MNIDWPVIVVVVISMAVAVRASWTLGYEHGVRVTHRYFNAAEPRPKPNP